LSVCSTASSSICTFWTRSSIISLIYNVEYQGRESIVAIPSGEMIEGELPSNKMKLLAAWIEIHQEELMADWSLATKGQPIFKIEPLR